MKDSQPPVLTESPKPELRIIRLNNPAKRNALSLDLRAALIAAVKDAMADDAVRALVLTGSGGAFCAGGDISSMHNVAGVAGRQRLANLHELVRLMVAGPKPVIAAVEGYAYGAGMSLALLCDQVVTASDAKFCCSFNKVGLMPDMAALWTVPQRVNAGWTRRLLMLAEEIAKRQGGSALPTKWSHRVRLWARRLRWQIVSPRWRLCRSASSSRRSPAARSRWRLCWPRRRMARRCCSTARISPKAGMRSWKSGNRSSRGGETGR
jgi:hypothetical protein